MIGGISFETLGFLWAGALLGGIVAGSSGFAFGLAGSAIWLHRIDPLHSAIVILSCGTLLHLTTMWPQRRHVEVGRLWPFVMGGLIGIPIGILCLAHTDASLLKTGLGVFFTVFGIYAFVSPRLPKFEIGGRPFDGTVGFIGGVLSGIGGYSGVLPTIWTQVRGWPKEIARAVYQPYVIIIQTITLVGILYIAFDRISASLVLAAVPPTLLGTWIGWQLYGKLDERRFRQAIALLLIASGVTLLI